ncbi:hypothetical protein CK203_029470 [Vitis vinifera]|uniref:Uncharacterized protein n=1 Tax=Vitis vinifera TaxID=29760 RepID=A0A438JCM4_VITVI|nr:hypothetical protein CK203_029470 [Vitis vinifera]
MVIGWVCRRQSKKSGTSSRAEFTSLLAMEEDVWEQVREVDGGALAFLDSFMIGSLME